MTSNILISRKIIAATDSYPRKNELRIDQISILCPLSLKPMKDAVIMDSCGHSISQKSESQLKKNICPIDGKEYSNVTPNFQLRNLINDALPNYAYKEQGYQVEVPTKLVIPNAIDIPKEKGFDINTLSIDELTALVEKYPFVLELRFRRALLYTENKELNRSLIDLNTCILYCDKGHKQYIKYAIIRTSILHLLGLYDLSKELLESISQPEIVKQLDSDLKLVFDSLKKQIP